MEREAVSCEWRKQSRVTVAGRWRPKDDHFLFLFFCAEYVRDTIFQVPDGGEETWRRSEAQELWEGISEAANGEDELVCHHHWLANLLDLLLAQQVLHDGQGELKGGTRPTTATQPAPKKEWNSVGHEGREYSLVLPGDELALIRDNDPGVLVLVIRGELVPDTRMAGELVAKVDSGCVQGNGTFSPQRPARVSIHRMGGNG